MGKRTFKLFMFLLLIVFFTGCSKFSSDMEVKKDNSMTFSILYSYSEDSDPAGIVTDENRTKLLNQGFTIEDYSDGNNKGVKITKTIDNIEDVSEENKLVRFNLFSLLEGDENLKLFKVQKSFLWDVYTARFYISNKDGILNGNETVIETESGTKQSFERKKWGEFKDFKFNLKVPYFSVKNNANEVSSVRSEMSWDLSKISSVDTIEFDFYMLNKRNILILVGGVVLFIMFIGSAKSSKDDPREDMDRSRIVAPRKETYHTPVNIPNTPVTTNEVSHSDSFNFLKSKSDSSTVITTTSEPSSSTNEEVANDIFNIKSNANDMNDVGFIMSSQLHNVSAVSPQNDISSNTNTNTNNDNINNTDKNNNNSNLSGMSGLEAFMNSDTTLPSQNNNSAPIFNQPVNNGNNSENVPNLMTGIDNNNLNK